MRLLPNVNLIGLKPELAVALTICESVYTAAGVEFVVTSCNDGKHMENSKHYVGAAFDCRTRDMTSPQQVKMLEDLLKALTNQFDVVLEKDHIHVEFDPK